MSSAVPDRAGYPSGEKVQTGNPAMSTIHEITRLQHPAAAKRQVYSPLEAYWKAFLQWRKRRRLQTHLYRLMDSELRDIGITRSDIDDVALSQSISLDPLLWMSDIGSRR
jgi:uncharacterized protein YjiS (DUF1127 family)